MEIEEINDVIIQALEEYKVRDIQQYCMNRYGVKPRSSTRFAKNFVVNVVNAGFANSKLVAVALPKEMIFSGKLSVSIKVTQVDKTIDEFYYVVIGDRGDNYRVNNALFTHANGSANAWYDVQFFEYPVFLNYISCRVTPNENVTRIEQVNLSFNGFLHVFDREFDPELAIDTITLEP